MKVSLLKIYAFPTGAREKPPVDQTGGFKGRNVFI